MRGPIRKELIACFKREFQLRFPQFAPGLKDRGFWTWNWKLSADLTLFIALYAIERYDKFSVEVAWSDDGGFPWASIGRTDVDQPLGREAIGVFFKIGAHAFVWDLTPEVTAAIRKWIEASARGEPASDQEDPPIEQVLPRIEPMVRDAIEKLEEYGIPLLRRVVEARKLSWEAQ